MQTETRTRPTAHEMSALLLAALTAARKTGHQMGVALAAPADPEERATLAACRATEATAQIAMWGAFHAGWDK